MQNVVSNSVSNIADIPAEVDTYRNLFPLEPPPDNPHHKSKTFGYPTTCYKALNTKDGHTYCLRRIHGKRTQVGQLLIKHSICNEEPSLEEYSISTYLYS